MRLRLVAVAVAAALGLVTGCGDDGGDSSVPAPSAARRLTVSSAAFADGGTIPRRHTCDGANVSPPLDVTGVPHGAAQLVVLVEDRDAPHGTFVHWLVWGIGPRDTHWAAGEVPRGATQGSNGFGKRAYGGPCPPRGTPHRYVFSVYAADRSPGPAADASADDVRRALTGHTLAVGTLTGRYGR
ncbi:YbhB/YbcL family Raf kinase inhibitor-like protein [Streptomyces sp. 7R007]